MGIERLKRVFGFELRAHPGFGGDSVLDCKAHQVVTR